MAGGRALVTGGAGFIGSHVVDRFLEQGFDVLAIDDLSTGRRENVATGASFEEVDVVDGARVQAVAWEFRPTVIAHLAAQASVTFSVREPGRDLDVNVRGTFNVCEAGRESDAPVVFASTGGALYGDDVPLPAGEDTPTQPLSPYGASKVAGEAYVTTWARLHGQSSVVLRLGNVYGPRQNPHGEAGVVAIFSEKLENREPPTVYGDGEQTRDYVHVADVSRAFAAAAARGRPGTYNVGTGVETTVNELLRILQQAAGTAIEPQRAPLRPGELKRSVLDSSLIELELGWHAEIPVAEGLTQTYRSYVAA
jgi:UDP-glucose 4-epimerase